jgi:hypothetical protein
MGRGVKHYLGVGLSLSLGLAATTAFRASFAPAAR